MEVRISDNGKFKVEIDDGALKVMTRRIIVEDNGAMEPWKSHYTNKHDGPHDIGCVMHFYNTPLVVDGWSGDVREHAFAYDTKIEVCFDEKYSSVYGHHIVNVYKRYSHVLWKKCDRAIINGAFEDVEQLLKQCIFLYEGRWTAKEGAWEPK